MGAGPEAADPILISVAHRAVRGGTETRQGKTR